MPSRPVRLILALAVALVTASGCRGGAPETIELTGAVADDSLVIAVPTIDTPAPARSAALAEESASVTATPTDAPRRERPSTGNGTSWARVSSVSVRIGENVARGDVLVELDNQVLQAEVEQAKAAEKSARATAAVLGVRLDEASRGVADIEEQRSQLATTLVEFEKRRAEVQLQLDVAKRQQGSPVPTGTPDATETVLALQKTLTEIDLGIKQTQEALQKLNESGTQVEAMLSGLEGAKRAAEAFVEASRAGISLAEGRLARARIISPTAGVVTGLPRVGDVLAAGAPLVTLRPEGATEVITYVTAEQREQLTLGSSARITADSLPGRVLAGAITEIGIDYVHVPSYFATDEIHMTRAFPVTIVVYGETTPPPGTPVDISIDTLMGSS